MADSNEKKHTAGALDIRNVIGALLTAYGVILLVTRLVDGDEGGEKTAGVNANLWAGLGLLVVGLVFIAWSRLRPVVVPEHTAGPDDLPAPKH
ncbi:hypothetical protein [Nocardioides litoris]|uniref:hypothetical protein n=1 Tax=Nocardioides litoris TaxID=1926648 RepID=UPI001121FCC1|nr:hypothetical protein [Nocardioides litoris]